MAGRPALVVLWQRQCLAALCFCNMFLQGKGVAWQVVLVSSQEFRISPPLPAAAAAAAAAVCLGKRMRWPARWSWPPAKASGSEPHCLLLLCVFLQEKEVARQVVMAFNQNVCGFDLLRSEKGKR
eukprot:695179-Pelagomonas_calceolata.AAC.1